MQELEKPAEITERKNFDRRSIKQIKQTIKLINWFIPQLKTKSLNKKIFTVDKSLWKSNKSLWLLRLIYLHIKSIILPDDIDIMRAALRANPRHCRLTKKYLKQHNAEA